MGNSGHDTTYIRVGGDDGELRPIMETQSQQDLHVVDSLSDAPPPARLVDLVGPDLLINIITVSTTDAE